MIAKASPPGLGFDGSWAMRPDAPLLVVGSRGLRESVWRALPETRIVAAERALAGLWESGQQSFGGIVIAANAGTDVRKAVKCLRQVSPAARIVVICDARQEPLAREIVSAGADDYLLEPLSREELEAALKLPPPRRPPPPPTSSTPSLQELVVLGDILKQLADGPAATLDRFARLLMHTFRATGVYLEHEGQSCGVGEHHEPVIEQPILRQEQTVGRICLARAEQGSYSASAAVRLADYARLIDATLTQSRDRELWRSLAWTDDLSGLHNRRYFDRTLDELLLRAATERLRVTVLLFDIDDFKAYNDRFGHETGDALIREFGVLLKRCSRDADVVARYGGDEFAVVFWDSEKPRVTGSQHPTDPTGLADRFCSAIREHSFHCLGPAAPGPVTISGGLATFPWDGADRPALLRAADAALLAAKRAGKNTIQIAGSPRE